MLLDTSAVAVAAVVSVAAASVPFELAVPAAVIVVVPGARGRRAVAVTATVSA
jgi:hypothetical protein